MENSKNRVKMFFLKKNQSSKFIGKNSSLSFESSTQ